ncbi:MAG TPA: glycosyltransferase [Caulobacteraceae bacterium]
MRTVSAVDAQPTVSVIVPHYRDLKALAVCLETLRRQTYPASKVEIIVADNASPEGETAIARAIGDGARLVIVAERGAGPARNGGVAVATGEILAFIDSDCQAEPEWLAEGVKALADYDFVGGRVKVLVDDPRKMSPAEAFERVFAFDFETYITRQGFTGSGNLFCPRTVFEAVGGFLAGVSEDVEWSQRARSRGFRLGYAPRAIVGHPARRTWGDLREKWRKTNLETYGLIRRRGGGRLRWLARNLVVPLSAVVHTPRVLFSHELNTVEQRLSGLAMLYWLRCWRLGDALRLVFAGERATQGSGATSAAGRAGQML